MVGPARYPAYHSAREDLDHLEVFRTPPPQRKGVAEAARRGVRDRQPRMPRRSAGGILVARLRKRGVAAW